MTRTRRVLRLSLAIFAALWVALVAGLAAILLLLQSEAGQTYLGTLAGDLLTEPGGPRVRVARITVSPLLARLRASELAVADQAGDWVTVETVDVDWRPLGLLRGRLRIDTARLAGVTWLRLPADLAAGGTDAAPLALPFETEIAALDLRDLTLRRGVLGQAATFALQGRGRLDRDGRIDLELRANRTDGPKGTVAVQVEWLSEPSDLRLALEVSESAGGLIAGLLDLPELPGLTFELAGRGPTAAWEGTARGRLDGLASLESRLRLSGGAPFRLSAKGTGEYLGSTEDELRELVSSPLTFTAEANWAGGSEFELVRADIGNEMLALALSGRYDVTALRGTIEATAAVKHAPRLALESAAMLQFDGPEIAADIRALRLTMPELAAVLQAPVRLFYAPNRLAVDGLDLEVDGSRISGSGQLLADGIALSAEIKKLNLGTVRRFVPELALNGIVNGQIRAEGPLSAPAGRFALTVAGGRSSDPTMKSLPALSGEITGIIESGRLSVTGDLSAGSDTAIALTSAFPFRLSAYPFQLDISADEPIAAQISITGLELAQFAGGLMAPSEGRLDGKLSFAGSLAQPTGQYDMTVAGLRIKSSGLDALAPVSVSVQGALQADGATLRGQLRASEGSEFAVTAALPTRISIVPFAADLRSDAPVTATVEMKNFPLAQIGRVDPAFPLIGRASGTVTLAGSLARPSASAALALSGLRMSLPEAETLTPLAGTVTARLEDDRVELTGDLSGATNTKLRLHGETQVHIAAMPFAWSIKPDAPVSAEAQVADLPASALATLTPTTDVRGRIAGIVRLSGTLGTPQGTFKLTGEGLRLGDQAAADMPSLNAEIDGKLDAAGLSFQGTVGGLQETTATLEGRLPMTATLVPVALDLKRDLPAAGTLRWAGDVGPIFELLPVGPQSLDGRAEIALDLAGTVATPRLSGRASLTDGAYEHLVAGTVFEAIDLVLAFDGESLAVQRGMASDGGDGRIVLTGRMQLGPDFRPNVDLSVQFNDVTVVRRDELTATIGGQLRLAGTTGDARLTGRIETKRVEANLLADLPRQVADLAVVEAGAEAMQSAEEQATRPDADRALRGLGLDLAVAMPGNVFIRGRGLDSEWRGEFTVRGTAAEPRVTGSLRPLRGDFSAFGKSFELGEGSISLAGGKALDPILNLRAVHDGKDLRAVVQIQGPATAPEIELTSEPSLPQDEIVSRLLFEKGVGEITAFQALQVADTVATFSGRGTGAGGVLGVARRTLGVDALRVEEGEGGTDDLGVGVGKRVFEDVYVDVTQGSTPGSSRTRVQVDVTPNLQVESDVSADARTGVGIKWKWDY